MDEIELSRQQPIQSLSAHKARLVDLLLARQARKAREIPRVARDPEARVLRHPSSPAQQRLWFIDQIEGGGSAYHIAEALKVRGALDLRSTGCSSWASRTQRMSATSSRLRHMTPSVSRLWHCILMPRRLNSQKLGL